VPAPAETEDAAVRKAVAQRIDDFKIADQMKRAGVHDLTFDDWHSSAECEFSYCGGMDVSEVGAGWDSTVLCGALGQLEKSAASCDASQNGSRADRPHRHSV
jgi:hypothetical protein